MNFDTSKSQQEQSLVPSNQKLQIMVNYTLCTLQIKRIILLQVSPIANYTLEHSLLSHFLHYSIQGVFLLGFFVHIQNPRDECKFYATINCCTVLRTITCSFCAAKLGSYSYKLLKPSFLMLVIVKLEKKCYHVLSKSCADTGSCNSFN